MKYSIWDKIVCAVQGHRLELLREGNTVTGWEHQVRACDRCGHVNVEANIIFTPFLLMKLKRIRVEPGLMIERTRSGRIQIVVTARPKPSKGGKVKLPKWTYGRKHRARR